MKPFLIIFAAVMFTLGADAQVLRNPWTTNADPAALGTTNASHRALKSFTADNNPDATGRAAITLEPLERSAAVPTIAKLIEAIGVYSKNGTNISLILMSYTGNNNFDETNLNTIFTWTANGNNASVGGFSPSMAQWISQLELGWQNLSGVTVLEEWRGLGTPYTIWGTNFSYRHFGYNMFWETGTKLFLDSNQTELANAFYAKAPNGVKFGSMEYPYAMLLAANGFSAAQDIYGSSTYRTNTGQGGVFLRSTVLRWLSNNGTKGVFSGQMDNGDNPTRIDFLSDYAGPAYGVRWAGSTYHVIIPKTGTNVALELQAGGTQTTNYLELKNNSGTIIGRIDKDGKLLLPEINSTNGYRTDLTLTTGGTTGNQTINKSAGTVNFAAGASSLTVTSDKCTASSLVYASIRTGDATAVIKNIVPGSGSFVINLNAAATAETSVGFFIINPL